MNLKEKIKNYTTYIVDDRDNKWEVIELSDLQDLLDTDRAEQLILHGVVDAKYNKQKIYDMKPKDFLEKRRLTDSDYQDSGMINHIADLLESYSTEQLILHGVVGQSEQLG